MHYHKFVICKICKRPITCHNINGKVRDTGTFNPEFGACHTKCVSEKLLWRERVLELEALK